jgi:mycofactocin precursor
MEPVVDETTEDAGAAGAELVEEELLIEEISIDGMCGVY